MPDRPPAHEPPERGQRPCPLYAAFVTGLILGFPLALVLLLATRSPTGT